MFAIRSRALGRIRELNVLQTDPAARVARAAVEVHRDGGRRRPVDVRVRHLADLDVRALEQVKKIR